MQTSAAAAACKPGRSCDGKATALGKDELEAERRI